MTYFSSQSSPFQLSLCRGHSFTGSEVLRLLNAEGAKYLSYCRVSAISSHEMSTFVTHARFFSVTVNTSVGNPRTIFDPACR